MQRKDELKLNIDFLRVQQKYLISRLEFLEKQIDKFTTKYWEEVTGVRIGEEIHVPEHPTDKFIVTGFYVDNSAQPILTCNRETKNDSCHHQQFNAVTWEKIK